MVEASAGTGSTAFLWPEGDLFRLLGLLQVQGAASLAAACVPLRRQLQAPIASMRSVQGIPAKYMPILEAQQALAALELASSEAAGLLGGGSLRRSPAAWQGACQNLSALESSLRTDCRYCYGPDWDVRPGKLSSRKGTWLKSTCGFSWEVSEQHKLYVPQGVVMPILQIGKVIDHNEKKRHEWVGQHIRVWLKPSIIRMLEERRGVWFVYWPHFVDRGLVIVPQVDTWLKRTTQMSGEVDPFELVYVPKGLPIHLACEASIVDEDWEKHRHQHVHLHRKVVLASPPLTVKQDKYDIFAGQREDRF